MEREMIITRNMYHLSFAKGSYANSIYIAADSEKEAVSVFDKWNSEDMKLHDVTVTYSFIEEVKQ